MTDDETSATPEHHESLMSLRKRVMREVFDREDAALTQAAPGRTQDDDRDTKRDDACDAREE